MSGSPPGPRPTAGDPSMEDILASIRRILSDEDGQGVAMSDPDPVLQLDPSMMVPEAQAAPSPPTPSPSTLPPSTLPPAAVSPEGEAPAKRDGLVAPEAAAAAALAVSGLVRTLTAERAMQVHSGGPTIEDIVRMEIRPLLKHWLDANLPLLVERLVRAEIERVVGRAVP